MKTKGLTFDSCGNNKQQEQKREIKVQSSGMPDVAIAAEPRAIVKSAHGSANKTTGRAELIKAQQEVRGIDAKIEKISNLLAETSATAPQLRKIESLEQDRSELQPGMRQRRLFLNRPKICQGYGKKT